MKQATPRKRSRLGWSLLALATVLITIFIAVCHALPAKRLQKLIDDAHAAGQPVTLTELNVWGKFPELVDNAAPLYEEAFTAFVPLPDDQWDLDLTFYKAPDTILGPEVMVAIDDYLARNEACLDLLYEASAKPECRFTTNFGADMPRCDHLIQFRSASRVLCLDALQATEHGDLCRAVAAINANFAMGDALRTEPYGFSTGVRFAVHGLALDSLEWVLSRQAFPEDLLGELADMLPSFEDLDICARGLVGDRCEGMQVLDDPATAYESYYFSTIYGFIGKESILHSLQTGVALNHFSGAMTRDRITYFAIMNEAIEVALLPPPKQMAAAERLEARRDASPKSQVFTEIFGEYSYSFLLPDIKGTRYFLRCLAKNRSAVTAVAVERYRVANGRLPDNLDGIVPQWLDAVPEDPFTGKPLHYRIRDKGYVVYSVGADLNDDGGLSREDLDGPYGPYGLDVPFHVQR